MVTVNDRGGAAHRDCQERVILHASPAHPVGYEAAPSPL